MSKLKMWNEKTSWNDSLECWEKGVKSAEESRPLKTLKILPNQIGITSETAKGLKWKSLKYMIIHDKGFNILKGFFKHPLKYGLELIKSAIKSKPYSREGDFFLYGVKSLEEFKNLIQEKNTLLVVGFSYCHKPFECPSGRFTDGCIHDSEHPVCRQCFIGKSINALPEKEVVTLIIPTIHYIGKRIFDVVHKNPQKKILFMITACELTLEMFGDWGNMVQIKGVGVRLDGRICNTMKAFELSEEGIKPGLTVVLDETKAKMLDIVRLLWKRT